MIRTLTQKLKLLHSAFVATILMNAAVGFGDFVVGCLFVFNKMNFLLRLSPNFAHEIQATGAFYFFSHAIIKLLLSWNLLHQKLWAYPVAIIFFSIFSVAQIIDLAFGFSWFVVILFVVNLAVLVMVLIEYRRIRALLRTNQSSVNL